MDPTKNPLSLSLASPSGACASASSSSGSEASSVSPSSGSEDLLGDGSSPSSPLNFGPEEAAFQAVIREQNSPYCPIALTAALQSFAAQVPASSPGSSPSPPLRAIPPAAPLVAASLEVSFGGSSLPQPSLAPPLAESALAPLVAEPALVPLIAEPSFGGTRTAAEPVFSGSPPTAAGAGPVSAAAMASGTAVHVAAAVAAILPIDRALFLRNQHELNIIRAQLKAMEGKKHVNPRRRGFVEGGNNKTSHTAFVTNHAHKVFDNMSRPILAGPIAEAGPGGHAPARALPPPPSSQGLGGCGQFQLE